MTGAFHWRIPEGLREVFGTQRRHPGQVGRNMLWLKIRVRRYGRFPIPGADVLANIATEKVLANFRAHLFRNGPTKLNREIGNAQAGIQLVSIRPRLAHRHNCFGRAGVNAAGASAAAIRGS